MIYRGRYLTDVSFIRPYWPYLALRWNVSQTRKDAPVAPKPMQTHCEIPAIYMMTNTMNMASNPPAKMNRYCAFKPLYSTDRPMPLLIEYSIDQRKNERRIVAATIRKIQAPNHEAAVLLVSGSPLDHLE